MSDSWDDYADGWDSNDSVISYAEKAYDALTNTLDIKDCRILDFGCGTGLLTEKMASQAKSIVALDPAKKMIAVLDNKQLNNVITIADLLSPKLIETQPVLNDKFDIIVASSALAFVPDHLETISQLKQLLKPGGYLLQWDWLKENDTAGSGFSAQEIQQAYSHAGFISCTTSVPFELHDQGNTMPVVMALGQNSHS
ncbi:methyltransferase [Thalassotalea insulae]|uniref:Methyltransferase n=1 Tax=Thalassotalea insulae TaxID=2056778 RepID=A0ABQ6GV43_9GAMM|nr:class I SAM-dependent methyltransferase [Thalassotalea insulae]GLX79811.1 methyltransferase [Thalassotalea insulae]